MAAGCVVVPLSLVTIAIFALVKMVGGAFGSERSYCDVLIFDGARSLAAITDALRALKVPKGTMIEYFAREKRGQRIAL